MDDPTMVLDGILQIANVSAWIAIAYFFFRGKIISTHTFEMFIDATKDSTNKLATEVADKIEQAVETGVIKAYTKLNGRSVDKS